MTVTSILYLVGGGAVMVFAWVIIAKLKRAKIDKAQNKAFKQQRKKSLEVEQKKKVIREKHSAVVNDIINNPNDGSNVVPIVSREHNHAFSEPCSEDCPAYDK